ncbi:Maf-like protein [Leptospira fluminis]|uniref:dTTP/UTP pyrophosphatase n=1 Tax=Leptospira fluminis TaxID=2484979 RepID=A0A4V3JEW1_9LEPT|nr:nucleoside triphosphate pyrophosphatase [Leptospira fluminis]TGK21129.1 Maf-like protein [Leptospira fluminis]
MLYLRSRSPRRKEVFDLLGLSYKVDPLDLDESSLTRERPLEYLERITLAKLGPKAENTLDLQVSADTIVVRDDTILQKPETEEKAQEMILSLSGRSHLVYSGLGLRTGEEVIFDYDVSRVVFRTWNKKDAENYIRRAEPFDKAGAYGIQDNDSPVLSFEGSYTNILGFPVRKFLRYHRIWSCYLGN